MEKVYNFSEVLFFQEGPGVRNTQYTEKGVKLLNVANLVDGNVDLTTSDRYISEEEAYGRYKHFMVDVGDFIIASSGIKVEYIDKKMGFIEEKHLPLCLNTSTIRFKVKNQEILNIRYFMYYLKSQSFKAQLEKHITGSAQLNYGPSHLNKMFFSIPEMNIQNDVIENLDKIEDLINKRKKQLTKLDELVKARFVELFGDLKTNSNAWRECRIDEACAMIVDCVNKTAPTVEEKTPYKMIRTTNVKRGKVDTENVRFVEKDTFEKWTRRAVPQTGDIILTREAPMGEVGMVVTEERVFLGQRLVLYRVNPEQMNAIYLMHLIMTDYFQDQIISKGKGSTVKHLPVPDCTKFNVLIPEIELQEQFASFVEQTDKSKLAIQKSLDELETLKKALMQEYFG